MRTEVKKITFTHHSSPRATPHSDTSNPKQKHHTQIQQIARKTNHKSNHHTEHRDTIERDSAKKRYNFGDCLFVCCNKRVTKRNTTQSGTTEI